MNADGTITIGVIADTHVPDRSRKLSPEIGRIFRAEGVSVVLHAGDVSVPSVLEELGVFGPVIGVRGNRDWLLARRLPLAVEVGAGPVTIGMTHGHGGMLRYFADKFNFIRYGYKADRYRRYLHCVFPDARVVVFGHTHRQECTWEWGTLFFNPGAAGVPALTKEGPSVGILKIGPGDQVDGKITRLR
jgi:putative phosphoesterase